MPTNVICKKIRTILILGRKLSENEIFVVVISNTLLYLRTFIYEYRLDALSSSYIIIIIIKQLTVD